MSAGPRYQDLPVIPLNARTAAATARGFGGIVHGDDGCGRFDVEFPSASHALSFRDASPEWAPTLRDPITDPDAPCVLTTRPMTAAERVAD